MGRRDGAARADGRGRDSRARVALKGVTGVSIGAINAACIVGSHGRADARRRLKELWEDLRLDAPSFLPAQVQRDLALFGLPGFYVPRMDVWALPGWKYLYDTSLLIETLESSCRLYGPQRQPDDVRGHGRRCGLGRAHPLPEPSPPPRGQGQAAAEARSRPRLRDRAPAYPGERKPCAAVSVGEIGGAAYWDGGLVDNTPLGDAIDAFSDDPDADRRLVVMNLYPLRARLPQNLAEVQDRVHELSFGNRLRQDHDGANRVNDLIGTICELAALVPKGAITGDLKRGSTAPTAFKVIKMLDLDMQDPEHSPLPGRQEAEQDPADDQDGLRDFSPATVERRRAHGYEFARRQLGPWFEGGSQSILEIADEMPLPKAGPATHKPRHRRRGRASDGRAGPCTRSRKR